MPQEFTQNLRQAMKGIWKRTYKGKVKTRSKQVKKSKTANSKLKGPSTYLDERKWKSK